MKRLLLRLKSWNVAALAGVCCFALGQSTAWAQGEAEEDEDIITLNPFEVVEKPGWGATNTTTSTRIVVPLQEIPQSIAVVTAEFMIDAGLFDNREVMRYVSNVQPRATNHQPGQYFFRGIRSEETYINGFRAESFRADMAPFDRIEIIKGPASASVGRSSSAGLVNYVRKQPRSDPFLTTRLQFGQYSHYRASLDAGGPLKSENLTYRLNLVYHNSDSWKDLENRTRYGVFPSFRWRIGDKTDVVTHLSYLDSRAPAQAASHWWNLAEGRLEGDNIQGRGPYGDCCLQNPNDLDPDAPLVPEALLVDPAHTVAEPGDTDNTKLYDAQLVISHRFNDWLTLRQAGYAADNTETWLLVRDSPVIAIWEADGTGDDGRGAWNGRGTEPVVNDLILRNRAAREREVSTRVLRYQGDLLFDFEALKAKHKFLFGYEFRGQTRYELRYEFSIGDMNMTNPFYGGDNPGSIQSMEGVYGPMGRTIRNRNSYSDDKSWFYQYQVKFLKDKLSFMYGQRFDWGDSARTDFGERRSHETPRTTKWTDGTASNVDSPRYGGTFKPVDWLTFYGLYSQQRDPTRERNKYGTLPGLFPDSPPVTVSGATIDDWQSRYSQSPSLTLWEAGMKSRIFQGRADFNVTWFKLLRGGFAANQPGRADILDTDGSCCLTPFTAQFTFEANGETIRGIEMEFVGQITDRWTVLANGTKIFENKQPSGVVFDDGSLEFIPKQGFPEWQVAVFTKYDITNDSGKGLKFSFGGVIRDGVFIAPGATTVAPRTKDFATFDAGVGYHFGGDKLRHAIDFKVTNLNDVRVILAANSESTRRAWMLTWTTDW